MAELTPEERERIYNEEKARKDAQDSLKKQDETEKQAASQKQMKQGCLGCLGLIAVLFVVFYGYFSLNPSKPASVATAPQIKPIDKSERMQSDRLVLINNAIDLDVFKQVHVNKDGIPRVLIGRTFNRIDFAAKENALSVVYAFYFAEVRSGNQVIVADAMTGQEIGRYDSTGLHLN